MALHFSASRTRPLANSVLSDVRFMAEIQSQLPLTKDIPLLRIRLFWNSLSELQTEAGVSDFLFTMGVQHATYNIVVDTLETRFVDLVDGWMSAAEQLLQSARNRLRCRHVWMYVWRQFKAGFYDTGIVYAPRTKPMGIVFTDIVGSTAQWCKAQAVDGGVAMYESMLRHQATLRSIIRQTQAYEVKTVGDAFMIACADCSTCLLVAVLICVRVPDGLVLRIGFHMCHYIFVNFDRIHQRYDYYGLDVNVACRVASLAIGGQILTTDATYKWLLREAMATLLQPQSTLFHKSLAQCVSWRVHTASANLKGIQTPLFCIHEALVQPALKKQYQRANGYALDSCSVAPTPTSPIALPLVTRNTSPFVPACITLPPPSPIAGSSRNTARAVLLDPPPTTTKTGP